jgi:type IV secretion system protein VirD4
VRLILNQIGRRLTETLPTHTKGEHRLLLMLDEFPALGRLDFFESSLAFLAGYGVRAFLVAQSLHQIDKAYGPNHAILDNCHVRVAFAPNDERTARRLSDTLGTTTELRAQKNLSGRRLAAWLSHVTVSEQETARPLLTPGEILQFPADEGLVLVSGVAPIRAQKLQYYADRNFLARRLPAPTLAPGGYADTPPIRAHDWPSEARATYPKLDTSSAEMTTGEEDPPRIRQITRSKSKTKPRPVHDLPLFADLSIETDPTPPTDVARSLSDDDDTVIQFPGGVRV